MTQRFALFAIVLSLASIALGSTRLEAQERPPLKLEQVVQLLDSGVFPDDRILFLAGQSCLAFQVNEETAGRLGQAGASEDLVSSLRDVCIRLLIVVTPAEFELHVDSTEILEAEALDQDSARVPGVVFQWSSEDTSFAEVNRGGLVVAKAPGETHITARIEGGPSATALVRVVTAAAEAETPADSVTGAAGKSGGTAAALGIIPGGGEFYVGNTTKGVVVLAGAAAALAAGFLLTSEDTLSAIRVPTAPPGCVGARCDYPVRTTAEIEETSYIVVGAAVAGAFWLYGLIDGIRTANRSGETPAAGQQRNGQGLSLQIAPVDGIRVGRNGDVELTFVRIRS